jgi:hypothetical protein
LLEWLFSGLGLAGVQVPRDFSLKNVITFFLQLMGITWPNIRKILARHIGEENVALIEQAWTFLQPLIEQGPQGVFDMIKEQLNPQNILDTILQMAVDFVIETLIKQVAVRVIGLLNPAGAIYQALELIYKVLKWVFENAARIFRLVETVVNGIADILQGNISGMANAVERALGGLLVPVIDFLASFLGLGDLPEKVAEAVMRLQAFVLRILDRVIGWVVEMGRRLLTRLGLRQDEESANPRDHSVIAAQAVQEMEITEGTPGSYEELRAQKEQQAHTIEQTYSSRLEEGIGLRVIFRPPSSDKQDNDLDFQIIIAPNTTIISGKIDIPLSPELQAIRDALVTPRSIRYFNEQVGKLGNQEALALFQHQIGLTAATDARLQQLRDGLGAGPNIKHSPTVAFLFAEVPHSVQFEGISGGLPYPTDLRLGPVSPRHAEGKVLAQLARYMHDNNLYGGRALLFVDKPPCGWCRVVLPNIEVQYGVRLEIISPTESGFE